MTDTIEGGTYVAIDNSTNQVVSHEGKSQEEAEETFLAEEGYPAPGLDLVSPDGEKVEKIY